MTFKQFELVLLGIVLVTISFFTITIAITYWKSRKPSDNYLENKEFTLRYFIQKQVDYHDHTIGYECLLRQQNPNSTTYCR